MNDLLAELLELEWDEFQKVQNVGGRAACQDDRKTFEINRKSQFAAWSRDALTSYLDDLKTARYQGRNLFMEKYARMMAWTHPEEYRQLEPNLPPISDYVKKLVDIIVHVQLAWQHDFASAYARLASRGRPIRHDAGNPTVASFEAYLRSELLTYSVETLNHYARHIARLMQQGVNPSLTSMDLMVRLSGFESLEQAEARS